MKFNLTPLAYLVMLAVSNSVMPVFADEVALPTTAAYPDSLKDQLPDFEQAAGKGVTFEGPASSYTGTTPPAPTLDVNTTEKNTLINWGGRGFDVGADATVNFNPGVSGTAVLNYDSTGSMSIVNGAVNANGAKLFLVNPDGISDTSGSFTALIANDAENVTLGTDGRLRIKNAGDRIYGSVSGQVDTSQDLTVDLVEGAIGNSSNMILGGDHTTINITNPDSGSNLISNTKFEANSTEISASEGSTSSLRLENTTGGNLTVNNFKNTTVAGQTDLDVVTVNNASVLAKFASDSATGSLKNINVNNGSVDLTQNSGVLIIDGMKHNTYIGNVEAEVSGGAVLDIRNSTFNLNSDGDIEDSDSLPAELEEEEINNSALFSTDTGGGTISLINSAIIAEGSIYFEDSTKEGTLNLTNTDLLVPEANVMVTPGTKIVMSNGFALDSDFNPDGYTRGVIVIDPTKVEGAIDAGRQYFSSDDDYAEYSSEKTIYLGFNQINASGGGAMENREEFNSVAANPAAPADIPNTGDGQETDPPTVDIPETPDDGTNPTTPGESDGDDGSTTEPGTGTGEEGDSTGITPGDGSTTEPGTGSDDGDTTEPGTGPDEGGSDSGGSSDDGSSTTPGTGSDGGVTEPGSDTGDDGSTTPDDGSQDGGVDPGTGSDGGVTDPGSDTGGGGSTTPGDDSQDDDSDTDTGSGDDGSTTPGSGSDEGDSGSGGSSDESGSTPGTGSDGGVTDPGNDTGNDGTTTPDDGSQGGDVDPGTGSSNDGSTTPGSGSNEGESDSDGDATAPGTGSDGGVTDPGAETGENGSTTPGSGTEEGHGDTGSGDDGSTNTPESGSDEGATTPGSGSGDTGTTTPGDESGNDSDNPGAGSGGDTTPESGSEGGESTPGADAGGDGSTTTPGTGSEGSTTEPDSDGSTMPGSDDTSPTIPSDGSEDDGSPTPVEESDGSETNPGTGSNDDGSSLPSNDTDPGSTTPGEGSSDGGTTDPGNGDVTAPGQGNGEAEGGASNDEGSQSGGEGKDESDIADQGELDPLINELLEPSEESDLLLEESSKDCDTPESEQVDGCESKGAPTSRIGG